MTNWIAWWSTPNWQAIPHVLLCWSCITVSWMISSSGGVRQVHSWPQSIHGIGRHCKSPWLSGPASENTFAFIRRHARYLSVIFPGFNINHVTTCTKQQLCITIFIHGICHLISPCLLIDYCHVQLHSTHCVLPQCCLLATVVSTACNLQL